MITKQETAPAVPPFMVVDTVFYNFDEKMKNKFSVGQDPCGTLMCACKQNGMNYVPTCQNCMGWNCQNVPHEQISDDEDDFM